MSKKPYPSETADRFIVRLPEGMRDRIRDAADANGRSMNAEIVHTLEKAYPASTTQDEVRAVITEVTRLMHRTRATEANKSLTAAGKALFAAVEALKETES